MTREQAWKVLDEAVRVRVPDSVYSPAALMVIAYELKHLNDTLSMVTSDTVKQFSQRLNNIEQRHMNEDRIAMGQRAQFGGQGDAG